MRSLTLAHQHKQEFLEPLHLQDCLRPAKADSLRMTAMQGQAVYAPEKEALVWKIRNFPGGKEYLLRCKFGLPSVAAEEEAPGRMPPIRVGYEIPYFTVSGIQVQADLVPLRVLGSR